MTDHSDRAHARLAPSSAHRWLRCPGSVRLSEGLQEAPSVFAAEGTAAHQLAEKCLQYKVDAAHYKGALLQVGDQVFPVNGEMIDAVQTYLDVVREIQAESDEFEVEQQLDVSELVDGVFGTGDVIAYRARASHPMGLDFYPSRVTIADFKYGKGIAVPVKENKQLLTYALGVLQRYHNRGVDEVELIIAQPRAPLPGDSPPGIRRWMTDVVGLYEHAIALQDAAARVDDTDAPLVVGPHCKFCKAAAICPEIASRVHKIIGAGKRDVLGNLQMADPHKYDADELAQKLKDLPLVLTWLNGVEQFGHSEAMLGRCPPGFKLVAKRATRKWKNEVDAAAVLQIAGLSEDDLYETKMLSPAQVETCIPKKERKAVMDELVKKESSGTSLAPIEDDRPAVDPNEAAGFEAVEI